MKKVIELSIGFLPWLMATLMIGGIVHIVSILLMPGLAPRNSFARIAEVAPLHKMVVLPRTTPQQSFVPFEDPAMALGACRFDLGEGALRLRGTLSPDGLMLFSLHQRDGRSFYSMTDRGAARGKLDVLILTQPQLDEVEANDNEDELPEDLRIVSPDRQGYVLVRALAEQPGDFADAEARIAGISCSSEREPQS
jgi:uncharacterized membrane protein